MQRDLKKMRMGMNGLLNYELQMARLSRFDIERLTLEAAIIDLELARVCTMSNTKSSLNKSLQNPNAAT